MAVLARPTPAKATVKIVGELRWVLPDVVVTFAPNSIDGHPNHVVC